MTERDTKQVIVIRRDLRMRRGKEIAQGAHAAMAFLTRRLTTEDDSPVFTPRVTPVELQWMRDGMRKIVVTVNSREELLEVAANALYAGLTVETITDSGLTEFHYVPTVTAIAIGPDYADTIDPVTSGLTLY